MLDKRSWFFEHSFIFSPRTNIYFQFVNNSEKLVVLRMGRAQKTRGPGPTLVLPCIDSTHRISTAITAFNVPPLQVIIKNRN